MKLFQIILICALNLFNYSFAQCAFPYPRHINNGGISFAPMESSPFAMDSSGTVYVGQSADMSVINLGNGITINGMGGFVAAYKSGNAIWRKKINSSSRCRILDIQVDREKNIFVSGAFSSNISIDSYNASGSNVCYQAFVFKMDSTQSCQWLHVSSGNNTINVSSIDDDEARFVSPDEKGGCYVSIYYGSYFTLGTTVFSANFGSGVTNSVLAHYDSNGTLDWTRKIYSTDGITRTPIIINDNNGGGYMVHCLGYACPLDTATISSTSQRTAFVMHFDSLGQYNWINKVYNGWWTYQSFASSINSGRCFNDGTLLLAGEFRDFVNLDTFLLSSSGFRSVYLARIDLNGHTTRFNKLATCISPNDQITIAQDGIDLLPGGGIYLAGILFGAADFNGILRDDVPGPLYAVRYDSLLNPVWCTIYGGGVPGFGHFSPYGIRTSVCGTAIIGGLITDPLTISPVVLNPPSASNFDFYLAELDSSDGLPYINSVGMNELSSVDFAIFPNPATEFIYIKINKESVMANVEIYDVTGKCVANIKPAIQNEQLLRLNISALQSGFYFIKPADEKLIPQSFIKL
ncbi:hypothetical protein BH09BAC5_BH09BAC5_05330 [soil metagenome]